MAEHEPGHLTDEQLAAAIIRALPIDHDDYTTVTRIVPEPDSRSVIWGRPEWVANEIVASIRSAEMEAQPTRCTSTRKDPS